ncbi:MAG TPA: adenylate/guanylate cyclase domain-containing protein [Polyangiales bacterium]|jgi:class 3 adenylate cyclase|nr:adenylate/guanylate cyclase domain-containing protein [Polyangiales bacterium]
MRNSIPPGGGSEDKLWRLIEQRAQPGADKAEIDRRIWDLFGERWAVMFTDLSGFSRGVAEFGITHFLQIIRDHRVLLAPILEAHDAIVLGQHADSMLVIFRHPRTALDCALAMQRKCQEVSRARRPEEKILLCLGLGYGDVLRASPFDVWGAEVNAASKLGEDIAKAHEILITGGMRDALGEIAGLSFVDLGKAPPGADRSFRVEYPRATPA